MYLDSTIHYYGAPNLIGDVELKTKEIIMEHDDGEGVCFVCKTNVEGIYTFGYKQHKEDYLGNPAGYVWSSRASVMNKVFGLSLVQSYYKNGKSGYYCSCAIDSEYLKPLLEGTNYTISDPRIEKEDISYIVIEK